MLRVVFLGDSGFGKLAASFMSAGCPVLTDDLLILRVTDDGVLAYPGPARIKLFPETARRFFGEAANWIGTNPDAEKVIIELNGNQTCSVPLPVRVIYSLAPPRDFPEKHRIRIQPLSPPETYMELVKNSFNCRTIDAGQLKHKLAEAARLASLLPARKLSIPRDPARLPAVQEAILSDLTRQPSEVACRA